MATQQDLCLPGSLAFRKIARFVVSFMFFGILLERTLRVLVRFGESLFDEIAVTALKVSLKTHLESSHPNLGMLNLQERPKDGGSAADLGMDIADPWHATDKVMTLMTLAILTDQKYKARGTQRPLVILQYTSLGG